MKSTMLALVDISIHAPTRGATLPRSVGYADGNNFNPRSHERSDKVGGCAECSCRNISIHAPTRGATVALSYITKDKVISIHAPTRGATLSKKRLRKSL